MEKKLKINNDNEVNVSNNTINFVNNKKLYYNLLRNINKIMHIIINNYKESDNIYYLNKQILESINIIAKKKFKE